MHGKDYVIEIRAFVDWLNGEIQSRMDHCGPHFDSDILRGYADLTTFWKIIFFINYEKLPT